MRSANSAEEGWSLNMVLMENSSHVLDSRNAETQSRIWRRLESRARSDFMSWQKPSTEKCPECGSYMVEKGNKLVCANEQCGFVMPMKENKEEKED